MSKIIYDVIQRFEVVDDVPRLISTNIQVIEGGDDLMSVAIDLLKAEGFYNNYEEVVTAQYTGYRLKNKHKRKRYFLVLSRRKDGLSISIPKELKHLINYPAESSRLFPYTEQVLATSKEMVTDIIKTLF